jgi:hypothetical protein
MEQLVLRMQPPNRFGAGFYPAPPTPPSMRVRTGRFTIAEHATDLGEALRLCAEVPWRRGAIFAATAEIDMDWKPHITSNPKIMHGAVCVKGTRVPGCYPG